MTKLNLQPTFDGPLSIPTFQPTMQEFSNFSEFIKHIEPFGFQFGLVKVIAPTEWKDSVVHQVEKNIKTVLIKNPIKQEFNSGGLPSGAYRQLNFDVKKSYSVADWHDACSLPDYKTPVMDQDGKRINSSTSGSSNGNNKQESNKNNKKSNEKQEAENSGKKRRLNPNEFIHDNTTEINNPDYLKLLERFYWKNLSYIAPMYGADLPGSFFNYDVKNEWNIGALNNLLSRLSIPVPGVNTPYLYFGMWKATFAWHLEDMDLFSINYLHFGAPKQWYVVPPSDRLRFERVAKGIFYDESLECPEFLRHKTCVISPSILSSAHSIPVHKTIQRAGEFIITFPFGYHQGFNYGFNCAESANFATDSWIEFGKKAKYCECVYDSVRFDVSMLSSSSSHSSSSSFNVKKWIQNLRQEHVNELQGKPKKSNLKKSAPPTTSNVPPMVIDDSTKCVLCPSSQGDMILTKEGKNCHVTCALLIPETFLINQEDKQVVDGVSNIVQDRWNLKCDVCKLKSQGSKFIGACVQCVKGKCVRSYHVSCAESKGITLFDEEGNPQCFCPQHDEKVQAQKREIQQVQAQEIACKLFSNGTRVIAKCGHYTYEGTVMQIMSQDKGCLVSFESGKPPCFVLWSQLKPIEGVVDKLNR